MTDAAKTLLSSLADLPATQRMPVVFVGHGSPMNATEDNAYTKGWAALAAAIPLPAAIVVISAHWLSDKTEVDVSAVPKTVHDFYGFPDPLYSIAYPAAGSPTLARDCAKLLAPKAATGEHEWGLDHGAWVPLLRMYPRADVPVFQLSIDYPEPGEHHLELGRLLAPLRDHGVLILASGNIVHNLRAMRMSGGAYDWATEFDAKVAESIERGDKGILADYKRFGASAPLATPTPDHYWPLLYALGAAGGDAPTFPTTGIDLGSVSMRSIRWG